eukprot:s6668_g3.t1
MTDNCRIVFEVESLRNASPATVSRAGIIFVSTSDLGWEPIVESWYMQRLDMGLGLTDSCVARAREIDTRYTRPASAAYARAPLPTSFSAPATLGEGHQRGSDRDLGNDTENNIRAFEMATSAGTCPLINMPTPMAQDGGLSPAASTAAPSDLLNLDASPQKRGRVDQPAVTMDALRDLFRGELQLAVGQLNEKVGKLEATMQAYRAESSDQIAEIKGECRGHQERLAAVNTRMDNMEARAANLEKTGAPMENKSEHQP